MSQATTQETLTIGRQLTIAALRAPFKASAADFALTKGTPSDWEKRKILPPFLGEMGYEIRHFLAAVEPWLRSGWRIPARRPEYYPPGTAFSDHALFSELNALLDDAKAKPLANSFALLHTPHSGITVGAKLDGQDSLNVQVMLPGVDEIRHSMRIALLEQGLRRCFARHHIHSSRPLTPWDHLLSSVFAARTDQLVGGTIALTPSYKPDAFVHPAYPPYPHVGVQFRFIPYNAGTRNSNVGTVLADAQAAAAHLGLPLLVYGHPTGTVRPEGLTATCDLAPDDLLRFELSMLSNCRVMLSPESGWCDLMCWLQVPTLLQQLSRPCVFACMDVFRPRVLVRDPEQPIGMQIEHLMQATEMLPVSINAEEVYDDTDWDGPWITQLMEDFLGTR